MSTFRLLCSALLLVFSCSLSAQTTFKIATLSPAGSVWMNSLEEASEQITKQTEGRVKFKFYGGGVMGDDTAVLRKMRARQLHGGIVQTSVLEAQYSDVLLYNLPMLFQDAEEARRARSEIDQTLIDGLARRGYVVAGMPALGFAYAFSSKSISSRSEANKLKVWSPENSTSTNRILSSFGINAIPLSVIDVLPGLQTGLIDTVAAPPVSVVALQWHSQVDYALNVPFMYIYSVFLLDARQVNRLSAPDQQVLTSVLAKATQASEIQNLKDERETLRVLADRGIEFMDPTDAELRDWYTAANKAKEELVASGLISQTIYQKMASTLEEIREDSSAD